MSSFYRPCKKKYIASGLSSILFTLMLSHAAISYGQSAQVEPRLSISQAPLFLGGKAAPNIVYNMDESWSMAWRYMPDKVIVGGKSIYGNPWAITGDGDDKNGYRWGVGFHPMEPSTCSNTSDGCTANGDTKNTFVARAVGPAADDGTGQYSSVANDLISARLRSSIFNTIYYDPEVMYEPWYRADGSRYDEYDPYLVRAPIHPSSPNGITVDLKGEHTFSAATRWCGSATSAEANAENISDSLTVKCHDDVKGEKLAPAVWYEYTGTVDSEGKPINLVEFENPSFFKRIRVHDNPQGFTRGSMRQDCESISSGTGSVCTQREEYTNFANWFTYNRTRMFLAIAATSKAFAVQNSGSGLRVGYARLHHPDIVERGVRYFEGIDRAEFFEWLYKMGGQASPDELYGRKSASAGHFFSPGTPLNAATKKVGEYFKTDEPWRLDPTKADSALLGCRKNYHILMTDGTSSDGGITDTARKYYQEDLIGLENNVPADELNPQTQQHMVNFTVGLGVDVPDLKTAAEVSKGQYLSATNVQQFAEALSTVLRSVVAREGSSASSIAANSTRLDSGTLIYQASFNSRDWTGRIRAYKPNQVTGAIDEDAPFWDTNKTLNRGSTRTIITPSGVTGSGLPLTNTVSFDWNAGLNADQKSRLRREGETDETNAKKRLDWIRGSVNDEGTLFRSRSVVLGDIVNSDPFFVGATEDFGFAQPTSGLPQAVKDAYTTFLSSTPAAANGKKGRREIIYVGGNDGMLHGFDANHGDEVFAYIPAGIFDKLKELPEKDYSHKYFVDGSPRAQDVFINGAWRTVLVGATGAGGKSVFALDVTKPDDVKLLWEYSGTAAEPMGVAMSAPSIIRTANGKWLAVFGNGYDKTAGNVKLIALNLADGSLEAAIPTTISAVNNGLATVAPVDINGDRITDYVYGGDLKGNLWRFDLLDNKSSDWTAYKRFAATDGTNPQPITTRPDIGRHPDGGLMVYFGTGKYFETRDNEIGPDPQVQTFYAIRDNDFVIKPNKIPSPIERANLSPQTIDFEGRLTQVSGGNTQIPVRVVSNNQLPPLNFGWRIDLKLRDGAAKGERSVSRPILRYGRIIFTTIIPNPDLCGQGGGSWLMELDAITGGRLDYSVLDVNNDLLIDDGDFVFVTIGDAQVRVPVSGRFTDEMIKTPGIVDAGEVEFKYTSGSSGSVGVIREKGAGDVLGRQSWRQLQ